MEERREAGEPISRVELAGNVATQQILLSIIPRELRTASPDKKSQADAYFRGLRSAMTAWTNVDEATFQSPARSYPVLFGTERVRGSFPGLDTQQDSTVLLYFPDDFPKGRYFYVFFWTDIHGVGDSAVALDELRALVDGFEVRAAPTTASQGCRGT